MTKHKTIVFIGRFQPFHNAHQEIIKQASSLAENVLVIIGSAHAPRTYKNPFSVKERANLILEACKDITNLHIRTQRDYINDDSRWFTEIEETIENFTGNTIYDGVFIGHKKDSSSFYLNDYGSQLIEIEEIEPLSALDIRELYFKPKVNMNFIKDVVPENVFQFLTKFKETEEYQQLIRERLAIEAYKEPYKSLPFPPVFVTADAVLLNPHEQILMVKRKNEPGKGLWALPGGYLDTVNDKTLERAALRELKEETGFDSTDISGGDGFWLIQSKVFDGVDRCPRGRIITQASLFEFRDEKAYDTIMANQKIVAADDAEEVAWIHVSDIDRNLIFEDHYEIIEWAYQASNTCKKSSNHVVLDHISRNGYFTKHGLCRFLKSHGGWSLADKYGKVLIEDANGVVIKGENRLAIEFDTDDEHYFKLTDACGEPIINQLYSQIMPYNDGKALVKILDGDWTFIDKDGNTLHEYKVLQVAARVVLVVKNGKYGLLNGEDYGVVIEPIYEKIEMVNVNSEWVLKLKLAGKMSTYDSIPDLTKKVVL